MPGATFFDLIRDSLFRSRLSKDQVRGIEEVCEAWDRSYAARKPFGKEIQLLSYVLASVYHETGGKMLPVREGFKDSDEASRLHVAKMFSQGKISGDYAKPIGGISYFGRGRCQNTHLANYKKLQERYGVPLVQNPNLILADSKLDARITVDGHIEGFWTGRKLQDYLDADGNLNYIAARAIVNGDGKKNGALIASYAKHFEEAFVEDRQKPRTQDKIETTEKPITKSKTVIGDILKWVVGGGGTLSAAFSDWKVTAVVAVFLLLSALVAYGIYKRQKHSKELGV